MKHVIATNASAITGIKIKELGRIAYPGEEFDVSDSRYVTLSGKNPYHKVFVILFELKKVEQEEHVIEQVEEPKRRKRKSKNE